MTEGFDRRAIPPSANESTWAARDGHKIRRIDWPVPAGAAPRGSILFLPGRGDFYEKYLETLDSWNRQGWRVTASDWRWQAGSGRMGSDARRGDVSDFAVWVDDLAALWAPWAATTPGPHVLAGHSMGGHLVLRAAAEQRVNPDALVLSAPMLGFVSAIPAAIQHLVARIMCRIGDPGRLAWPDGEKPGARVDRRADLLTHDPDRYADELWWRRQRPALDMGPATWRWVERAAQSTGIIDAKGRLEALTVPVLLLAAEADGLVSWPAIRRAAARLPKAQLASWGKEAAHELLREADGVRDAVLRTTAEFLDRNAPPDAPRGT